MSPSLVKTEPFLGERWEGFHDPRKISQLSLQAMGGEKAFEALGVFNINHTVVGSMTLKKQALLLCLGMGSQPDLWIRAVESNTKLLGFSEA